jgi:hypothetical protein
VLRLFIIPPSLARLIRKERGGERVVEGYFPDQPGRSAFVQIEESGSSLILEVGEGAPAEEPTNLPLAHGQALLAVSQGEVEYLRTRLSIGSHEILTLHFVRPRPLDIVAVEVGPEDGQDLPPLAWFGPEVSAEPAYQHRRLALDGAPEAPEAELTNAALNGLLDLLEDRLTAWPLPQQAETANEPTADAFSPPAAPMPVPETETDEEIDNLGIEDEVIRELARALQPRRGG